MTGIPRATRLQRGFTLIETLVALGLMGVLIGLLLPAVQAAREAARRAQCAHHLRQLALAASNYHEAMGCFPINSSNSSTRDSRVRHYVGFYSLHARMLPYLDQTTLYNGINFDMSAIPPETLDYPPPSEEERAENAVNSTVASTGISLFLCPSDAGAFALGGCNYRGNVGVGPWLLTLAEYPDSDNGLFSELRVTRAALVPDGLSHTAAFSERLRGSGGIGDLIPHRDFWPSLGVVLTADQQIQACRAVARRGADPSPILRFASAGHSWFWSGRERTLYTHAQPPNGEVPDCLTPPIMTSPGMATARSFHFGGVNAVMGDGSVRFVQDSVAVAVWRGLGTRNGREIVD